MKIYIVFVLCIVTLTFSQHPVPFASQNNMVTLAITNNADVDAEGIVVELVKLPAWISVLQRSNNIMSIRRGETANAQFTFSIDKSAPVGKQQNLHVVISSSTGEQWNKDIAIQVSAPEQFELYQNYPNPFNPSTTIGFQLPYNSTVSLKIYDILGKEVTVLFEGMKAAGYHQMEWQAVAAASGVYILQVSYKNAQGEDKFQRMKMVLAK